MDTTYHPLIDLCYTFGAENAELRLAIENDALVRNHLRHARNAYEAAEASVLLTAHCEAIGKNAESRKAEVDVVLAAERTPDGELGALWTEYQNALDAATLAAADLECKRVRFATTKACMSVSMVIHGATE